MKKIFLKHFEASFTIEASVIIPISFVVFLAIIFMSFYAHDRVVIDAVEIDNVLKKAPEISGQTAEIEQAIRDMLPARVMVANGLSVDVDGDEKEISVTGAGKASTPLYSVRNITGGDGNINSKIRMTGLDARAEILKYKAIIDGAGNAGLAGDNGGN